MQHGLAEEVGLRESAQDHMFRAHRPVSNRHSLRQRIQGFPDWPLTKVIVGLLLSLTLEEIDPAGYLRLRYQETFDL